MESFDVIGLMSGTSLDGVDIAFCSFTGNKGSWTYSIIKTDTVSYSVKMREKLANLHKVGGRELILEHKAYGFFLGRLVADFCKKNRLSPQFIASHGHTIFHEPQKGITFQLGEGQALAIASGLPVVNDFRTADVLLGGQGAPLVPAGDRHLFADFAMCLNIGGFSNISFEEEGRRVAFDIGPANTVLNRIASKLGHDYDPDGSLARSGKLIRSLFGSMNKLEYYQAPRPKSLGREWLEMVFLPLIERRGSSSEDLLNTVTHHIAFQVATVINTYAKGHDRVLITGGGVRNQFLVELIRQKSNVEIIIPDPELVDFKESLVFAFLGLLRWINEINCFSSVTGASRDSCCGVIHLP
jgi:anhydro-N-acetylmuramic acid kinase